MPASQLNGFSTGFDLRRFVGTTRGLVPEVDSYVGAEFDKLDQLLGRRIFDRKMGDRTRAAGKTNGNNAKHDGTAEGLIDPSAELKQILSLPLKPRRAPKDQWAEDSVLSVMNAQKEGNDKRTLSDVVDATPGLAALKYAFQSDISANLYTLQLEDRTVLGYPVISDYLVAYAFHVMGLQDVNSIKSFVLSSNAGANKMVDYAVVSGARAYLDFRKLEVDGLEDDDSSVIRSIAAADIGIDADVFTSGVDAVVQTPVFNGPELKLIEYAETHGIGPIPTSYKPALIQYIQQSKAAQIPITEHNVLLFVPGWIQQIARSLPNSMPVPSTTPDLDADFSVEFFDEGQSQIQVSRTAVKCAAQLYYGMILGDELGVFDAMNYFTHTYLVRGSLTIEDSKLRDDLQSYVFSNRFTDLRTGRMLDRTRPAERAMFYRQVFNSGSAQVNDEVIVNRDFPNLWKVLMLESAKFLERAQISPNPDTYVSRQNVLQSVEDLQYNLSTHCVGMANVVAPLIYAELNFVIRNIFMNDEVIRQIVPSGGSWWRVVEALSAAMKGTRPKATVLCNKGRGGQEIISAIADYDPASFAKDQNFAMFIGTVERFITTQSILQDAVTDDLVRSGASGDPAPPATDAKTPAPKSDEVPEAAAGQEWNF